MFRFAAGSRVSAISHEPFELCLITHSQGIGSGKGIFSLRAVSNSQISINIKFSLTCFKRCLRDAQFY